MHTPFNLDPVGTALDQARRLWTEHEQHPAAGTVWRDAFTARTLPNGTVVMSARVHGDRVRESLVRFAEQAGSFFTGSRFAGDQVPVLDLAEEGREAVVWRSGGVWVELWASTVPDGPETGVRGVPSGRRTAFAA